MVTDQCGGGAAGVALASSRQGREPVASVWLADFNPTRGHEQAGRRPVLVVSEDLFNRGPAGFVHPPEGGVKGPSSILCEAVRSISVERLVGRWGAVSRQTLAVVEDRLRILLRL